MQPESISMLGESRTYVANLVESRRKDPGDDLISVLVDPRHADALDTQAVLVFATILLVKTP